MEFIQLLRQEVKEPIAPLLFFSTLIGIANAILLAVINKGAESVSNAELSYYTAGLFIICLGIFIGIKKYVTEKLVTLVEVIMNQIRCRIADKVRRTELNLIEKVGVSPIYARLTQDNTLISNSAVIIINSFQSMVLILFATLYIGSISMWSFFLVIVGFGICFKVYAREGEKFEHKWLRIADNETDFVENLGHILKGFKEIKINRSKNESVLRNYALVNRELRFFKTNLNKDYMKLSLFSQAFFYFLLGSIVFIIPHFHTEHSEEVLKITAALLFIMGPFEAVLTANQYLAGVNSATRNIMDLEAMLESELIKNELALESQDASIAYRQLPYAKNIEFKNLSYAYPPTKEQDYIFEVGPINLTFKKGELIFITGGNGSGKSTFLKLLTGLYPPKSGEIWMDVEENGQPANIITAQNYQQYRNLFTTIFTDFHLFDKLYGIEESDPKIVNRLLLNMELSPEKTTYKDGGFTNTHLSSGQKKRLALTTSIMEDKDIYIFDEVAADLDPEFRDKYYYEILPELKDRNKTVIVVSHDRDYWSVPDRLLEMTNGQIKELSRKEIDSLLKLNE